MYSVSSVITIIWNMCIETAAIKWTQSRQQKRGRHLRTSEKRNETVWLDGARWYNTVLAGGHLLTPYALQGRKRTLKVSITFQMYVALTYLFKTIIKTQKQFGTL